MTSFRAETGAISAAGVSAADAAAAARAADVGGPFDAAARAVPGAACVAHIAAARDRLSGRVARWATAAEHHGTGLEASAAGYEATDGASSEHLLRSGRRAVPQ